MTTTENFTKRQEVVKVIYACHQSVLKIEIKNENYHNSAINVALQRLLHERKEVAKSFVETKFTEDGKNELIELFSKYNEEICKIVGLCTIEQVQEHVGNSLEGSTISSLIEEAEEEFRIFDRMSADTGRKVLDLVKKQQQKDESKP